MVAHLKINRKQWKSVLSGLLLITLYFYVVVYCDTVLLLLLLPPPCVSVCKTSVCRAYYIFCFFIYLLQDRSLLSQSHRRSDTKHCFVYVCVCVSFPQYVHVSWLFELCHFPLLQQSVIHGFVLPPQASCQSQFQMREMWQSKEQKKALLVIQKTFSKKKINTF